MFWLKSEPILGKTPTLIFNCPPPAAAGRNKLKTTARAQKILRGRESECPPRKFFVPSPFNFIFFQRWNHVRVDIIYILVYGKVFSSSVELSDL